MESFDYYFPTVLYMFRWCWNVTLRRRYLPAFSNRLIAARLDWVCLGVL